MLDQTRVQDRNNSDDELFHTVPKRKRVSVVDIPLAMRYDKYGHWPVYVEMKNAQGCKYELCKSGKSMFKCSKCNLFLCLLKRDCFVEFHLQEGNMPK